MTITTQDDRVARRANDRVLKGRGLERYGLPDPLSPLASTSRWDDLRAAVTVLVDFCEDLTPTNEARIVAAEFLSRVETVRTLKSEIFDERCEDYEVDSGYNEESDYRWLIYDIEWPRGDHFTVVEWGGEWIQLVRDEAHAHEFLRVLADVVRNEDGLPSENWEDWRIGVDCTGWRVRGQCFATMALDASGTVSEIAGSVDFDPDFALELERPDGTIVDVSEGCPGDIPEDAAAVLNALKGGSL